MESVHGGTYTGTQMGARTRFLARSPSENLTRINLADPHEELLQFIPNYHFTDWAIRRAAAGGEREAHKMVMVNYYYYRFHMSCFDA